MEEIYRKAKDIIDSNESNGKIQPERVYEYMYALSCNKENPYDEWQYHSEEEYENATYCTCGHIIHNECRVINKVTGEMLLVGIDCIKKFFTKDLAAVFEIEKIKSTLMNDKLDQRMKYQKFCGGTKGKFKHLFRLRKNTRLYKILQDFDTSIVEYCPWYFVGDKCYVKINHKYYAKYDESEWYRLNILLSQFEKDGKIILCFHIRS